ncbi:MAG TPA: hypothetical protein VFQ44_09050 [Streptosporangiaceae bacterium]|nr:hypothetical protein [Streptosporangiaceae bacterium]
MSVETQSAARSARTVSTAGLARLRFVNLVVLVLVLIDYGIGMYVNLYVDVPKSDHGGSIGSAISNGPATISIHAALGLLLALGALAILVQAIMARRWTVVILSVVGLFAMVFASLAGTTFTTTGDDADSMAMAVMAGVAVLCYALNLYVLRPGRNDA